MSFFEQPRPKRARINDLPTLAIVKTHLKSSEFRALLFRASSAVGRPANERLPAKHAWINHLRDAQSYEFDLNGPLVSLLAPLALPNMLPLTPVTKRSIFKLTQIVAQQHNHYAPAFHAPNGEYLYPIIDSLRDHTEGLLQLLVLEIYLKIEPKPCIYCLHRLYAAHSHAVSSCNYDNPSRRTVIGNVFAERVLLLLRPVVARAFPCATRHLHATPVSFRQLLWLYIHRSASEPFEPRLRYTLLYGALRPEAADALGFRNLFLHLRLMGLDMSDPVTARAAFQYARRVLGVSYDAWKQHSGNPNNSGDASVASENAISVHSPRLALAEDAAAFLYELHIQPLRALFWIAVAPSTKDDPNHGGKHLYNSRRHLLSRLARLADIKSASQFRRLIQNPPLDVRGTGLHCPLCAPAVR